MDSERFRQIVHRLEQESEAAPAMYRAKVAALMLLGFGILAFILGFAGFGLLLLVGIVIAMVMSGGAALLVLLKLGKLLLVLGIPLFFMVRAGVKALFIRLPAPQGCEIGRTDAPALFAAIDRMRKRMRGPPVHHVLIVDQVNAGIVQRPAFGLFGWPRNYLMLGLPLLECLPPEETLAVVAHEYGHLAGSHGHFSAFIYRLRHTWNTVLAYVEALQGWLARLVAPVVRWYAPYFSAYTFALARADEFKADEAAAELVGSTHAAMALKRVNVAVVRHRRFMQQTFERADDDAQPPADLMQRWATLTGQPPADDDARRWLGDALDREGHFADSHPTLRSRLSALSRSGQAQEDPPPPIEGESAAQAWLGALADTLRAKLQADWARQVERPWAERHGEAQALRRRLGELRALADRDRDQQIEVLKLTHRLEPGTDLRDELAAFNAAHAGHALGLYLEGCARLEKGERTGLSLLDSAMELDPNAIKPGCERAGAFLAERKELESARTYAERWRHRDAWERLREQQLHTIGADDRFVSHGLPADAVAELKARLTGKTMSSVAEVYLARRIIPADPTAVQLLLAIRLGWLGRRYGRQREVAERFAKLNWPVPLVVLVMDGRDAPILIRQRLCALADARLV